MKFTKTNTAKFVAGLVGFAFAAVLVATPVATKAQTSAELQAMINTLLAQIAALQGQVGGSATASHTFTMDLTVGSTGAEVTALQQFLTTKGFLHMPAGVAMGYFGEVTRAALAAFQSANGITPAVGYFGPATRAKVNSMGMVVPPTNGGTNPGSTGLQGGAGDITVTSRSSGTEDQVMEGEEESVLGFEVEADGSDVALTSVRVELEHTGSGSTRPERYMEEVSIMQGGKVVGSADVSDFSKSSGIYSKNIPVSGAVVRDGRTERFTVSVTANSDIDTDNLGEDWNVSLGSIRFNDATGAILTNTDAGGHNDATFTETFTFEDLSTSGDVKLTASEDDSSVNDAHTVQVDDTSDTNDVELLSFKVKAKGSDLSLIEIPFSITSTGAGVTEIINDLRLEQDGEEIGTVSLSGGFGSSVTTNKTLTISDIDEDDVVVNEDDTMSFTLVADINDIEGNFTNSDSIAASTTASNWIVEDQNGDTVDDLNGTVSSDGTKFSANGIMVDAVSTSHSYRGNLDNDSTDDQGVFEVVFDVTAFDDSAFIDLSATRGTTLSTGGVNFTIENANTGSATTTGSVTGTVLECVSNCGTVSSNRVEVEDGETARFKLTMYFNPTTADIASFRGQLYSVNSATTNAAPTAQEVVSPSEDYQTGSELVQS